MKSGPRVALAALLCLARGLLAQDSELVSSSSTATIEFARVEFEPPPTVKPYGLTLVDGALYISILAYRTMDFFSTQPCLHSYYCSESELPTAVVATKGGFATFEAGMAATEIGTSLWLHRHGRHKVARAMSVFSVSAGTWAVTHNYNLRKY